MKRAIHIVCVWVVVGLASGNIAYADGLWQITTVDSVGVYDGLYIRRSSKE